MGLSSKSDTMMALCGVMEGKEEVRFLSGALMAAALAHKLDISHCLSME